MSQPATGNARVTFPVKIMEIMERDPSVYFVFSDAAQPRNTTGMVLARFPDRAIDVGIAESNMIGTCAGLALAGKRPFCMAFGPFLSLRALDQIHTDIAYNDLPVCIIGTHGGLTSGGGPTHYTIMDIAVMSAMPNISMVVPADANQGVEVIEAFMHQNKPMYIRLARGEEPLAYTDAERQPLVLGRAITARQGGDCTLIATGVGVYLSLEAAKLLAQQGIAARVLDMHTVCPLDRAAVLRAARETGAVLTVEDHSVHGGLGSAVAETILEAGVPCRFRRLGIPDTAFAELGSAAALYAHYGFDAAGIAQAASQLLTQI